MKNGMERENKSFLITVTINTGMSGHLLKQKGKKDSSHLKKPPTNQHQKQQISRPSCSALTGCRCPAYTAVDAKNLHRLIE